MDPITLAIVGAITAGVAAAGPKVIEKAITDGYETLKNLLVKKFGPKNKVMKAVKELEANPASTARQAVLAEEVKNAEADKDTELLRVAKDLTNKLRDTPRGQTIINQIVSGNQNIFTGTGDVVIHDADRK